MFSLWQSLCLLLSEHCSERKEENETLVLFGEHESVGLRLSTRLEWRLQLQ